MKPNIKAIKHSPPHVREVCRWMINKSKKEKTSTITFTYQDIQADLLWKIGVCSYKYTNDQVKRALQILEKNFAIETIKKRTKTHMKISVTLRGSLGYKHQDTHESIAKQVIDYLNMKTKRDFKYTESNFSYINGRTAEGHKLEDFKKVIDIKVAEWLNKEESMYLRPITLFSASKFEGYLNQQVKPKTSVNPKKIRYS